MVPGDRRADTAKVAAAAGCERVKAVGMDAVERLTGFPRDSLTTAMTAAIEEGLRTFDFLRGAEPYKYRWGARDRWNLRRVLRPATPAMSGVSAGRTLQPGQSTSGAGRATIQRAL